MKVNNIIIDELPCYLKERYFSWLYNLVSLGKEKGDYFCLLRDLFEKKFYWSVPNDDNRAAEGKALRERFCDEYNIPYIHDYFDESCSMLELIIALAYRCESIMADQENAMDMKGWFWKLLSNANLDIFTDEIYKDFSWNGPGAVEEILNKIIQRTYGHDGKGGLFPMKSKKKDQRKVELWYQMCAYLLENYYSEE